MGRRVGGEEDEGEEKEEGQEREVGKLKRQEM